MMGAILCVQTLRGVSPLTRWRLSVNMAQLIIGDIAKVLGPPPGFQADLRRSPPVVRNPKSQLSAAPITETVLITERPANAQVALPDGSVGWSTVVSLPHFALRGKHRFIRIMTAEADAVSCCVPTRVTLLFLVHS